ncbi:hypothetical protein KW797_01615 [Candidatus Parcubacteria bacterium]|nr:hypothetical protein [Candidatus Parcubacteria bacterium]
MQVILPALMPTTKNELEQKLALIKGASPWVQLDVMDGDFVPNVSYPYVARGKLSTEHEELPFKDDFSFEFDLMVRSPERMLSKFIHLGATRIVFHYESADAAALHRAIREAKQFEIGVGMALSNDTNISVLGEFAQEISFVQVMGIARIGFQGEPFDERALLRLSELRAAYPRLILSVDGSVNSKTAKRLVDAGATRLVVGSAVWEGGDPMAGLRELAAIL